MIETKDLTNFARHLFSHSRGSRRTRALYPEREWFFIVGLFLVIFLGGAVMSVWYYRFYNTLPAQISGRQSVSVPAYQAAAVEQAHTVYREREEKYTSLYTAAIDGAGELATTTSPATTTTSASSIAAGEESTASTTRSTEQEPVLQSPTTGF